MAILAEANLSVRRSKRNGVRICAASGVLGLAFLGGLWQGSYWALAIPVSVGVLSVLWLLFWIGYTIATVGGIPEAAEHYSSDTARHIARGICAASILLGVMFVIGMARQSYWVLAIPVAGAVLSVLGMVFWIGWAIVTQKTTLSATRTDLPPAETGDRSA